MARALVVDDSRTVRMILSGILCDLKFEVQSAGSGEEALQYLETSKPEPELMLVDWNMPGIDGLEFVRRVRKMKRFACSQLMMVTTETEVEQIVSALDAGANEYVMKPFTHEIIEGKLSLMGLLR